MSFVADHAGKEHYESDSRLYGELFPESPLVPELKSPPPFRLHALSQRILSEILDVVEPEKVFENRKKAEKPKRPASVQQSSKVAGMSYKQKRKLVKDLGLDVPDLKNDTITTALLDNEKRYRYVDGRHNEDKPPREKDPGNVQPGTVDDTSSPGSLCKDADKKKEAPG